MQWMHPPRLSVSGKRADAHQCFDTREQSVTDMASRSGLFSATGLTGLEPATFRVTGGRSNQLSDAPEVEAINAVVLVLT
ncbi:MAG: hypothetical protein QOC81_103 [Thermoanaerobaculia bacterium]|nr:hypothetical protein [Thermoanaerobaculia bacterium]